MKSACLLFPFEADYLTKSLKRATTVNDAIKSAIRMFCLTEKGQRRGNSIGSLLPSLQHKLIPSNALPGIAQEVQAELSKQFPGVIFSDVTLTQDLEDGVSNLRVSITFSTVITGVDQFVLIM